MATKALTRALKVAAGAYRTVGCYCTSTPHHIGGGWMVVQPEVSEALASSTPVVALETTIVSHGMPYPVNLQTALEVEGVVRSQGAVPATVGVLDGRVYVGMSESQLERLASPPKDERTFKISRRDIAYILSQGCSGGTTVSGTMLCAHKAGIPVFVTGGIGGVHRDGEKSLDISADLTELGRTSLAVVCAGVKSILDIGRTLEYLETQGVAVATFGDRKEFPAFFTANSGFEAPYNVPTPLCAAKLINANLTFNINSGILIGVPIPTSIGRAGDDIEQAIQEALSDAKDAGITGKAVTPYVLQRVNELTGGQSLEANIALIKHNAKVGSQISVELSKLRAARSKEDDKSQVKFHNPVYSTNTSTSTCKRPAVIGASILDFTAKIHSQQIKDEGTNPGSLLQSFGGVGRNIAECMSRLGTPPLFLSAVGWDQNGRLIADNLQECGMSLSGLFHSEQLPTASYCAVLEHTGELYCAIGDMAVNHSLTTEWVGRFANELSEASLVCVDGNIPTESLAYICNLCSDASIPVWYEPTCVDKSIKPIMAGVHSQLAFTSPNLAELRNMHHILTGKPLAEMNRPSTGLSLEEKLSECRELIPPLLSHIPTIMVSLGKHGLLYCNRESNPGGASYLHYPSAATHLLPVSVTSVTGAGDSFVGAMISGLTRGLCHDLAVKAGLRAAYSSLHSQHAVSRDLSPNFLTPEAIKDWASWDATVL